jgi:hypothetical protein
MLSKVEWWARHERMAEDGGHPWRSLTVTAVPGLDPGIGPGHPDDEKRRTAPKRDHRHKAGDDVREPVTRRPH